MDNSSDNRRGTTGIKIRKISKPAASMAKSRSHKGLHISASGPVESLTKQDIEY